MHTILRAFVTSTIYLQQAEASQIDQRGAQKSLGSLWAELPRLHHEVITIAEELLDQATLAAGRPHELEPQWLRALVDEVAHGSTDSALDAKESWAWLARSTGWLAFCLAHASVYAEDAAYGRQAFEEIKRLLAEGDAFERALTEATITQTAAHFASTGSELAQQVADIYGELVRAVTSP